MRTLAWFLASVCLTLVLAVGLPPVQAQPRPYVVLTVDLARHDGERGRTFLTGRNRRQESVGSFDASPVAFLLHQTRPPTFIRYPADDVITTTLTDINDDGDSIGSSVTELSGFEFGFLRFREGAFQTIRFPGGGFTVPLGLNNQRTVVGIDGQGIDIGGGWMWKRGRFTKLPFDPTAITNDGTILGFRFDQEVMRFRGFLRDRQGTITPVDYPGASATLPFDRNEHGHMVGIFQDATGVHPFIVDDDGWRVLTLPQPDVQFLRPRRITDDGHITGSVAVPWVHPTDPDVTAYWVGFVAIPQPELPGIASRVQQQRSLAALEGPETQTVPANTLTLQPVGAACARVVSLPHTAERWQLCEGE